MSPHGEVQRGWLGVGIPGSQPGHRRQPRPRPDAEGALIIDVNKGGPSDGVLEEGDIVLEFDGKPVEKLHDLPRLVSLTDGGQGGRARGLRDGATSDLDGDARPLDADIGVAAPAAAAPDRPAPADTETVTTPGLADLVGFSAEDLTKQSLRQQYRVGEVRAQGVIITAVRPGSDAERQGHFAGSADHRGQPEAKSSSADEVWRMVDLAREAGPAGGPVQAARRSTAMSGSSRSARLGARRH